MKVMTEKNRPLGREQQTDRVPVLNRRVLRPVARILVSVLAVGSILIAAKPGWAGGG